MMNFKDQVAIITGAASGIGLAIAAKLLSVGVNVAVLDLHASSFAEACPGYDDKTMLIEINVTLEIALAESVSNVFSRWGRIDILINSAGITGLTNIKSHLVSSDDLHNIFELNFMAGFYASKAVLPFMLQKNYGRILHIASIAGKEGNAGMLGYSSSKAAVIAMAKVQGKEYAETGITINALAPAVVKTPLVDALPFEQVKYMTDKIPMKRCCSLEEITNICMYIVSSENSFTTGFTFDLSGGRATY